MRQCQFSIICYMSIGEEKAMAWCIGVSLIIISIIGIGLFYLVRAWKMETGYFNSFSLIVATLASLFGLFWGWYYMFFWCFEVGLIVLVATAINLPLPTLGLYLCLWPQKWCIYLGAGLSLVSLLWTGFLFWIVPLGLRAASQA